VFLRELKEAGVLVIKWILGAVNEADIFTKNLDGSTSNNTPGSSQEELKTIELAVHHTSE
jgi:hypothetical protein